MKLMQLSLATTLAVAVFSATPAFADTYNYNGLGTAYAPFNPYIGTKAGAPQQVDMTLAGVGFDTPDQNTVWGGWTRGDAGTIYAEWDSFVDANDGATNFTSAADAGTFGLSSPPGMTWNASQGAWMVSPFNNLVNFMEPGLTLTTSLQGAGAASSGPVTVVLQIEHWNVGTPKADGFTVNGLLPTAIINTYDSAIYNGGANAAGHMMPPGQIAMRTWQYVWELASAPTDNLYNFNLQLTTWTAVAQIAIDIAPVPEPETYAMFLAGLGLMGAIARRRRPGGMAA